jgi:PAS domain S-box-containing protein
MNDLSDGALLEESAQAHAANLALVNPSTNPHLVQFYDDDDELATAVARFVADGLSAGDVVTTIATDDHTKAIHRRLASDGVDVDAVRASGRLLSLDAHEMLARFMRDGEPDRHLFEAVIGGLMSERAAVANGVPLRAYGEMVDVLWKTGQKSAALHLEELWNDLQGRRSFTLLCSYAMGQFYKEPAAIHGVCATHTQIVGRQHQGHAGAPARATTVPAQYAEALAREILHREEVELALRQSLRELRAKEEELERSERQLQLITDALPVCVSYVDREIRYRFVSAAYEQWFGRSKQELLGRRVEDVVGRDAYQVVGPYIERALAGETVTFQGDVPYGPAQTRAIEATYIPQRDDARRVVGFVALVSDVSERVTFERFRTVAAARAERLVRITAAVAEAVTADEVFKAVVDNVAAAMDASSAALWLVDVDARTVKLARSVGYAESASREFDRLALDASPAIPVLDAIRRGQPIWIPSQEALLRDYPHLQGSISAGRSYRISCLPLVSGDRTLGALAMTIEEAREVTEEERGFLLLVARYAAQSLERLRLFEAEGKSRADADAAASRLALLNRASRAFGDADLDLEARLRAVSAELSATLDSSINVALIESDGLLHLTTVHHPIPEAHDLLMALTPGAPLRMGEGVTGTIAATGESALLPKIDPQAAMTRAPAHYRAFLQRFPVHAMIGAPLRVRGRIIGTVTAARCRENQTFSGEDLKLLEELAERAAVAIENSRLHREMVTGRARAEQLYRFAQSVVAADRVEVVFDAALAALEVAVGANRAAVLIFDADGVMRFRAWRNLSETYRRAVEGHSPWKRDALSPQPVLVADVETEPSMEPLRPLFREEGIGSLGFIPLVTRGRLIGKFMVYFQDPHEYLPHEVELATAIASHLASVTARFEAITKLEETIRYNELFAGVLAHDLRSPLGAIMTAAQLVLMRQAGNGDISTKPVSRIISSGQRMTRMIDQLLDVTRARSGGGIHVDACEANLGDLCAQAIGELELAFPQWTLKRESVGDLDGRWDPDRVLQIVSNLLSNAGQHGRPEDVVTVRLDGRDAETVVFDVHNGGSIPASLMPSLFDPFRGTRSRRDSSRGLGLGLFIVKEITEAHGGTVEVSSSEAEGTRFVVRLPRRSLRHSASGHQNAG